MTPSASHNHFFGYGILLLSAIIWGTEAIVVKLCYAGGFTVLSLLSLRYLLSLPMFALVAWKQKISLLPPRALLLPLLLMSVNVVAGVIALYLAIDLLPATLAILFFYAYPSFTSLLHVLLGRGSLGMPRLAALLLSALGLVLLYWSSAADIAPWGVICALIAALLQAAKLSQMSVLLQHISSTCLNFFNAAFTTLVIGSYYLLRAWPGGAGFGLENLSASAWISLLVLGLGVTVFANLFMTMGVYYVGAVDTSLVLLLEPLTTAALAYLFFRDTLSSWQLLGGLLILLAVAWPAIVNIKRSEENEKAKLS